MLCRYRRIQWLESIVFFQAEDGIRDLVRSRGLGDVYKRQVVGHVVLDAQVVRAVDSDAAVVGVVNRGVADVLTLSLIHI